MKRFLSRILFGALLVTFTSVSCTAPLVESGHGRDDFAAASNRTAGLDTLRGRMGGPARDEGTSAWAVVGIVAGVVLVGGLVWWLIKRAGGETPLGGAQPDQIIAVVPLDTQQAMRDTAGTLAAAHGLGVLEVHPARSIDRGMILFTIQDGSNLGTKVAALERDAAVVFAQPNFIYQTSSGSGDDPRARNASAPVVWLQSGKGLTSRSETAHADSLGSLRYGTAMIQADAAHERSTGSGVRVAVVDTGVDTSHVDLQGRIVRTFDAVGSGYTAGRHGTLMAGIIAARSDSRAGIYGVAPDAHLISISACGAACFSFAIAKGIDFALSDGAQVLNLSLEGPREKLIELLLLRAWTTSVIVVAAAGNGGPEAKPAYPAAYKSVIAVTAVGRDGEILADANRGKYIDLAAPGAEIVGADAGGGYFVASGTSPAAAFVSGAVALLLEDAAAYSPAGVQEALEATAKDLGRRGRDRTFGRGLVQAREALDRVRVQVP